MARLPALSYLHAVGEGFSFADLMGDPGFNYEITKVPLWATTIGKDGKAITVPVTHEMGVYRPSTEKIIGVVGDNYKITKNIEAAEFSKELCGAHGAKYIAYGAPNLGEQMYLVMQMPEVLDLDGVEIKNRILITSSHNGVRQIEVYAVPMHIHTGYVLSANVHRLVRVKHTKSSPARLAQAKKVTDQIQKEWETFKSRSEFLRSVSIGNDEAKMFYNALVPGDNTRHENVRAALLALFHGGQANTYPACRGTALGMWMACVEYADDQKTVRKSKHLDPSSAALFSTLMGDSARLKAAAFTASIDFSRQEVLHVR